MNLHALINVSSSRRRISLKRTAEETIPVDEVPMLLLSEKFLMSLDR